MRQRYRLAATGPVLVCGPFLSVREPQEVTEPGGEVSLTPRQIGHGARTPGKRGTQDA